MKVKNILFNKTKQTEIYILLKIQIKLLILFNISLD